MENQKYEDIVAACTEKGEKFTDPFFPPKPKSICPATLWDENTYGAYDWVRAGKVPSLTDDEGDLGVFVDDPSPGDVQ